MWVRMRGNEISLGVGIQRTDNGRVDCGTVCVRATDRGTRNRKEALVRIKLAGIFVDDQAKAERFYTEVLGFVKKQDIPLGEFRWLTVASPDSPDGMELLLEPNAHEAAKAYQMAICEDGIPATMFFVDDIQQEFERLTALGVRFVTEPTEAGPVTIAVFDDTCGNLIQLVEE